MRSKHLFTILLGFCFLASCKKNGGSNAGGNSGKLKLYIEGYTNGLQHATDTFTVAYDNSGRLTGLTSPILTFAYAYPTSKTATLDLYEYGQFSDHELFYLNSSLLIDSVFQWDASYDTSTVKYLYNGNLAA